MRFSIIASRFLFFLLAMFTVSAVSAQSEKESTSTEPVEVSISVGDTLVLGRPKSSRVFAFIDIFRKTRWDPDPLPDDEFTRKYKTYDSSTGNGFYRYFFRGDFDASELPASFEGQKFPIKGLEVVKKEKDGSPMNVVYLETENENTIIMVDIDNATQFGEVENVILARRKKSKS